VPRRTRILLAVAAAVVAAYVVFERLTAPTPSDRIASAVVASVATPLQQAAPLPATVSEPPASTLSEADQAAIQAVHARFATGDFVTALRLADEYMESDKLSDAFHAWALDQLPALLTSAGWAALRLGECEDATTYLRRAESLRRTLETAKGLAVCYYKQKNLGAAREQFSYYLERQANDAEMQFLYADVLESEGRYEDAVKLLETITTQDGALSESTVRERLASMRARAKESGFQQTETSRNFRLAYRAGDHEDLVTFVLQTLEDALDEYVEAYGFRPPPAPIEVALYPTENFKNIVVGGPEWAEGLFDGRLRIPVRPEQLDGQALGSLPIVLRHELVHALFALMTDNRSLPSWFDEGVAQRLACAASGCGTFVFPPTPGVFLAITAFSTPYTSFDAVKAGRAYKQSLYLIYALERQFGEDALRRTIGAITASSSISSDGVLEPLGLTFRDAHRNAAELWAARAALAGR
jgi:tetratricopeptide (TPR) repeat protein